MAGELTTLSLAMGRGVVSGGVVPVPPYVVKNGVTYTRVMFGDTFLDVRIDSQPLYGRPRA